MKRSIPAIASMLLVMTTAVGALNATAFADEGHSQPKVAVTTSQTATTTGNSSVTLANLLGGKENDDQAEKGGGPKDHGKHKGNDKNKQQNKGDEQGDDNGPGPGHHPLPGPVPTTGGNTQSSAVQALHVALDQLHKDQATAHVQHDRLVDTAHSYIQVMQAAVVAGDATVVDTGMKQMSSILATLNVALAAQTQADSSTQASTTAQTHGDLQTAINNIKAADAKVVAQMSAMKTAADALATLVTQLQTELKADIAQQSDTSTTTGTGSGTSNSTSNNTTGSVTVTVTNGSN